MSAEHEEHEDHGHSLAAWVCVGLLILAAAVGSWAVVVLSPQLGVVAGVIGVLGLAAGKALAAMGHGAHKTADAAGHAGR